MSKELAPTMPDGLSFMDNNSFNQMLSVAKFLAGSDLIPSHFSNKPANVFIALEIALRQGMSPFMVMQSLYVVHGRPGFEGKYLIALANRAGWNLQFDTKKDASGKIVSCRAIGEKNGIKVPGPEVTAEMVSREGWDKPKKAKTKTGHEYELPSKWVTMPSLMYIYRAGSYFVNTVCPELKMGMQSIEEIEDITETAVITDAPRDEIEPEAPAPQEDPGHPAPSFDTMWADYQGPHKDMVGAYLEAAAKHNKCSVDDMKLSASTNWKLFIPTFEKWAGKQAAKQAKESASAPPVAPEPETNGKALAAAPGPVMAISGEQIERIEELAKIKDCPEEVICEHFGVSAITELSEKAAYLVIDWLASK